MSEQPEVPYAVQEFRENVRPYLRTLMAFVCYLRYQAIAPLSVVRDLGYAYSQADAFLEQLEKDLQS